MTGKRLVWGAIAAAALAAAGCARIPYLKRFVKPPYYPYQKKTALYSFEYPRKWGEPSKMEFGAELREPKGRMTVSVEFVPKESKAYVDPATYRKDMSQWGSVEDEHRVYRVEISSTARQGLQARFTTYEYDARYLLGQEVRVTMTELTIVPDPRGLFRVVYRAPRNLFWNAANRRQLQHFLKSLVLSPPPEPPVLFKKGQ
ncbi:MAG: hypothetical protein NTX64_16265 [Elusimicrobia bacterium]|nr:hypothetical protein [Elusimicrobiota bacterium]